MAGAPPWPGRPKPRAPAPAMLGGVTGRSRPSRLGFAALAALGLAAASCAGLGASLRCPEEGGPIWRELATEHFQVWTDLDAAEARALAGQLEWIREAVVGAAWTARVGPESHMGVVALRSQRELGSFTVGNPPGWVIADRDQTRLVLSAPSGEAPVPIVAREVALHLADLAWLRQPRWLRAGLAAYLETVTPLAGGATALVGLPPPWTRRAGSAALPELLAWDARDPRRGGERFLALNASAWRLVHFLVEERGRAFTAFQGRLGAGEPPGRAWRESFPGYDPQAGGLARLERDLEDWAGRGRLARRAVPVPRPAGEPEIRAMRPAEIHALWAALFISVPAEWARSAESRRARAEEESARALAHDPAEPAALLVSIWLAPKGERSARARAAARAAPGDWSIWLVLAASLGPNEAAEREAALRRAREVAPDQPSVLSALARHLLSAGKAEEAVALAARAVEGAAWKAFPLDLLSQAQAAAGRCPEALAAARRALEILPDWAASGERGGMAARLAELEARCGTGDRRPAPPRRLYASP